MALFTSPRDILRALWRRIGMILLILLVGLPASVWFAMNQPRLYQATAIIQVEAPQVVETVTGQAGAGAVTANSQLDLIQQQLMSRDSMQAIVADLGLFPEVASEVEQVAALRNAISLVKLVDPAQAWRPDVQPTGLSITVRLGDAAQSAAVANELLDQILGEAQRRTDSRATRTLEFFEGEVARVGAQIAALEEEFARYKEANAEALPDAIGPQRDQLTRLNEARLDLEQQIVALETASDRLRVEERARQTQLLENQRELVDTNIAEIEAALARAPEVERRANAFERDLEQLESQFAVVTARRTEAAMAQLIEVQDQAERFEVLERAVVPEYPVSASHKKMAAAGGLMTVAFALGLALLLEAMQPTIRTAAQLERQLGVEPVIVVPRLKRRFHRTRWLFGWLFGIGAAVFALVLWLRSGGQALLDQLPFWGRVSVPARGGQ